MIKYTKLVKPLLHISIALGITFTTTNISAVGYGGVYDGPGYEQGAGQLHNIANRPNKADVWIIRGRTCVRLMSSAAPANHYTREIDCRRALGGSLNRR